jgi:hypothetical protein
MTWWETLPTLAATALVYFLPGLMILAAAGLRRLNLVALAAPVSASVSGMTAIMLPYLKLPFNPVSYFAVSVLAAAAVAVFRLLRRRRRSAAGSEAAGTRFTGFLGANVPLSPADTGIWLARLAIPAAVLIPAAIISLRYITGFGSPDSFSETFDNIYHLNAVRYIADTQNGSTLTLGNLTAASKGLYPAAMHDSMALVLMLGAPSVMAVVNVGTIVTGAIVWPLGCVFLISRIVGYRPMPLLAAGILSAGFSGFPYLMVGYGVLYPNHAAIALLPAVLGLAIEALGMSRTPPGSPLAPVLALAATVPGLALSHPSTFVALLGFATPVVIGRLIRSWLAAREGLVSRRQPRFWLAFTVAYLLATTAVWVVARPSLSSAGWTPFQTNARAIGEILGSAPMGTTTAWVMLVLTIVGLYVIARQLRRYWWVAGMYAAGAVLYLVVSSWSNGFFRNFLTGVWYTDSFRLAALLPVVTLPVVVLGAEWVIWRVRALTGALIATAKERPAALPRAASGMIGRLPASSGIAMGCVVLLALGLGAQGGTLSTVQNRISTIFTTTPTASLLSTDEVSLLNEVAAIVPEGDVVVGNPRTGASLVYAFSGRRALAPHIFGIRTPEEQLLLDHWDEAAYNAAVCPAIKSLKAYWALDFGNTEITPRAEPRVGVRDLTDNTAPGVKLVKAVGSARLFRVTACG